MGKTKIEWAEAVWNPVSGCSKLSEGCRHCYAERMAKRLAGRAGYLKRNPFAVTLHHDRLAEPLGWRRPRRVFVCSMSDLFHPDVPDEFIDRVFAVMATAYTVSCPPAQLHTFMVLTKRPERMAELTGARPGGEVMLPLLPNVWLGVSVEDQAAADERIPDLLRCPAAVRFVSYEPALGKIKLTPWLGRIHEIEDTAAGVVIRPNPYSSAIDWVIAGAESGPKARPAHPDWFRSVRDQCQAVGVPFFFKHWGEWAPVGDDVPFTGHEEALSRDGERSTVGVHLGAAVAGVDGWSLVNRVGKKAAGRLLDGREHSGYPNEALP